MASKIYYKITNAKENHMGFQYVDGLNILQEKFNDNPSDKCSAGGLYFTDIEHIFEYACYGVYVREVTLPVEDPAFKMVEVEQKYRANMIILGKRYDLYNVETISMLLDKGSNICTLKYLFHNFIHGNHIDMIKYLVEQRNISIYSTALLDAVRLGKIDIAKYLIEKGIDIHMRDDQALIDACDTDQLEIVKFLVENGANIHAQYERALINSAYHGYTWITDYLIDHGANIHAKNNKALRYLIKNDKFIYVRNYLDRIIDQQKQ